MDANIKITQVEVNGISIDVRGSNRSLIVILMLAMKNHEHLKNAVIGAADMYKTLYTNKN